MLKCDSCGFAMPVGGRKTYTLSGRQYQCCEVCADTEIATSQVGLAPGDAQSILKAIAYATNLRRSDIQKLAGK